jgi:hypothetical protein
MEASLLATRVDEVVADRPGLPAVGRLLRQLTQLVLTELEERHPRRHARAAALAGRQLAFERHRAVRSPRAPVLVQAAGTVDPRLVPLAA